MLTEHLRRVSRAARLLVAFGLGAAFLAAASANSVAAQQPDLVLNMTGSPDPVAAGGVVAYSISVLNDGPTSTATGVTVTVPVPSGASYSGFSGTGIACGGMTVGASGPGTVTCTLPNLNYLDVSNLTVSLQTSTSGPFPITATAAENETDIDLSNNSITVTTTVVAGADIAFSITAPSTIGSGSAMSYTLNLHNLGPDPATNLSVQFPIPTGFVFTGSNPSGCSLAASTLTCTVAGPIASGATVNIGPISGQVSAANTSTITASGSETVTGGGTADPNAANSSGTFNTTVTAGSDVSVAITRSASAPFFVGSSFNFQITAKYTGDKPNGLTITDVLPANYTIGSVTTPQQGWTCGVVGQTVTCTKASGGVAGSNQTLTGAGNILIPVTMNATGLVTNTVTISATSPVDPDNTNNSANDGGLNILTPTADLSISISGPNPALTVTGQSFTETSTVSNGGPSLFFGLITMTTHFPAGITVASYVQNGWSCSPAAQAGPVDIVCTRTYTSGASLASGTNTPSVVWTLFTTGTGTINVSGDITTTGANVTDPSSGNNSTSFGVGSSTGPNSADISINKTVDLATVNAGDVLTYTLEVVNNAPTQVSTNIAIMDALTTLINSSTGATGAGFISATVNANIAGSASCSAPSVSSSTSVTLSCMIPNLPPCTTLVNCPTFVVQIRPGGDGGSRSNTASIISSAIADPNLANNSATATNTVSPRADITVSMNGTPNPVAAGQPLTYVITATDNGPSLAQNVTVVDTLPIGTIFLSASPSSGSCATTPAVGATITALNYQVICNLGTINNGAQKTVTVKVTPANALQGSNTVTNSVGVTTTTTEPSPILQTNNQASVTGSVSVPSLDLTISNTDSPDPVTVGDVMAYTITVHNIGPSDGENVVITDNLPSALISYASVSFPGGTCGTTPTVGSFGGTVICSVPRLTAGSTVVLTINMTGVTKGVTSNTATVASDETPHGWENAANNTAVQNTTVRTRTDVQLVSKVASAATGFRRPFTWTILVSNPNGAGLAEADTVKVNDALPAGMELTAMPTAALVGGTTTTINACTGSAGSISFICSFGTMSAGGSANITVPVRMTTFPAGGTSTNSATATTSSQDINSANNSASGSATILSSSISGNIYRDFNTNGTQDAGDTGISGIVMTLSGNAWDGSAVTASVNSDASGNWTFTGLPESDATGYTVVRGTVATTLLVNGPTAIGDHAGTASVVSLHPQVAGIVLAQNDAAANYRFSMVPQARIGVAKTMTGTPTVSPVDGSYTIPIKILVQNYSQEQLDAIVINDPLSGAAPSFGTFVAGGAAAVLAQGQYTINAAPSVITGTCGTATLNSAFDGSGTVKVADMSTLATSTSCTVGFTIRWQPVIPLPGGGYSNQANATGTGHLSGQSVSDLSQNGSNPDTDADGDPTNNNVVTPIMPALVADVTTSVSFPATVNAGLAVSGTVLFKNTGPYTGSGMVYHITLSSNLSGVTFGNLPGGAGATYTAGTGVVVFTGMPTTLTSGQIASGDGTTGITVGYTQNGLASSTVNTTIATSTSQAGNTNPDAASTTVGGILIADVTTSMTFPALVNAGQSVVGHVVFKNTGPSTASGLTYSITLSSGLTGVSFSNLPAGATAAYVSGTGVVTLGAMPATATLNQILSADGVNGIQITYTQNATATSTVASTIATTTNEGTNTNANSANASVGGSLIADVTTTLTFPVVANAGDPIAGTIVFKNNGPSIASGVTYTLTATANLPGVTFGNLPAGATATYTAGTGVITLASMPATLNAAQIASGNGTSGITMNYTQDALGVSQINSGVATTTSQGANAAVDAASASPGGGLVADMTTILTFPATVNAGQPVSGTVFWKNTGPSIASGVTYTLTLNSGLTGVSFSNLPAGATATYVSGTGVVTLGSMPATVAIGAVVSGDGVAGVTVNYTQNAVASTTVTGNISTTTSEGANLAPNLATATVGGILIADVTTSMTFPALVNAGQAVVGNVVFKNTGPSVASGLTYSLTLGTGLTGVSFANLPAGASAAYTSGTGVVTLSSMPATATLNQVLSADGVNGIQVTYTQNATATSTVASTIATTTNEGSNTNANSANAAIGGALIADVTTSMTFPVVANAGDPIAGMIIYKNNGPSVASGVAYTLSATANLTGVAFGNLPGGATATYTAGTGVITLTGMPTTLNAAQIASGDGTTGITMSYTQNALGVSQINSGISTTTSQGANAAVDAAVANPGGGLVADMTSIVTFPASVNAGQTVTGTVLWRNNGPSIASGVAYTLTLNAGLAGVSFANLPGGATATYVPGTGVVTLAGMPATVAIGAIVSGDGIAGVTVNYTQNGIASTAITANISTSTSEGANIAPNLATTTVGGILIADVTTSMTFPALVNAGQPAVGHVVFKNTGPSTASGLTYSLTLSAGLTGVSLANLPAGATATYASATGIVTFGAMPATATINQILSADGVNGIQVTYTQNATATSAVSSTIATTTNEGSNANTNSAGVSVGGALIADVTTSLTFPVVANAGVPIAGTILYSNTGPSVASGVTYTLSATANLVGVVFGNLPAGATATYIAGTGVITLTGMPATLNAAQIASGNGTTGITMNYTQTSVGLSQINSGIGTTTNQGANAALDAASATPGGGLIADMTTIETFPALVSAGQPVTGTVLWRNNGPSIASGVTYTLTLSSGLAGVSFANLPAGATTTYVPGTGVVTLTGMPATVAIGAVISGDGVAGVTVNYTQNGAASTTITGNIATTTSEGANLAPNLANATVGGTLIADVTTTLTFPVLTVPGSSTDGVVVYRNAGPSISSGMTYTLTLAKQLINVTFTNLPVGATATYVPLTGDVTFTGMPATIAIGGVASADGINGIGVHYPQPSGTTDAGSSIGTTTSEGANALPDNATATVTGFRYSDLTVTKSDGVTNVAPSQTTVYTVRVVNSRGDDIAAGSTVTDTPTGLALKSVACSNAANNMCRTAPSVEQITGGLTLPAIAAGAFYEFLVTAQVTAPSGTVTNVASVKLPPLYVDLDSTNNSATDVDQVNTGPKTQIGIAKAASALQTLANGHFKTTFTMTIVNYSTETLYGVRVTDPLAAGAGGSFGAFSAAPTTAGQYTVSGISASGLTVNSTYNGSSDLLAASGTLAIGGTATVTFSLDFIPAAGTGSFTNQASATGTGATSNSPTTDLSTDGSDPDPSGAGTPGTANTPTTVGLPRLGLAKAASAPLNNGNGTYDVTFSMVIANPGGTPMTNVQITDALGNFGTPATGTLPAPGQYVISAGPTVSSQTGGATLVASSAFNGAGSTAGLLTSASTLPAASQASVAFTIRFFPRYAGQCINTAIASGVTGGTTMSTASSNGTSPDPTKVAPTTLECHGQNIGAALQVTTPVQNGARRFLIPYRALVRNMDSLSTATNVQLSDDIKSTFPTAQSIIIVAPGSSAASILAAGARGALTPAPAAGANFATTTCSGTVLNLSPTAFDGQLQQNMLAGNQNLLPREQCIFNFTLQVDFGTNPIPLVVQDMQTVATTAMTAGGVWIATDSSTNGPDPDPDVNGTPRNNSTPTPVIFTVTSALTVTKTTPMTNVVKGQLVPYTITVSNPAGSSADATDIRDMMPTGFAYRKGTASIDGTPHEPAINGRTLDWTGVAVAPQATHVVRVMLVVGAGATPGLYTNNAQAFDGTGNAASGVAAATVRVIPDATFDCSDIIGKIFDDKNGNGVQDPGERGLPGVRVVSARGWLITADADGKFHIACAAIPDPDRGSNFVLKLDERTLPTGYVLTTENPRSVRVTDGKMVELNFGATMRKLVRLDLTADAFDAGSTKLKAEWLSKIDGVHDAAGDGPFVLRVVFTVTASEEAMARDRLNAVISLIRERWRDKPWYESMQIERSLTITRKPEGGR